MSFVIGEAVRVAAARDAALMGLEGRVVLETMHTLTISTKANRKVVLPKLGSALQLLDGRIVLGDDLNGRLEDRIALAGRPARRDGRRRR